jgi:competence protein ComEC
VIAALRAHAVSAPVLDFRYYGPVEGRVVGIDRSASDATRLTLDRVVLARTDPERLPWRVRISLHGEAGADVPPAGARVILTAWLSPPQGPVEPGGFDFRRHAWFQGLGAVGYARTPVLLLAPPVPSDLVVTRARMGLSARVQAALPGEAGAFAAAILSGDRSGLGLADLEALRHANLAHLLAISGLHMGLLAGFVFAVLRLGLVMLPRIGPRLPAKKLAAAGALVAAAGYLALSGGNVATERAFVMAAVALFAVMLDRRPFSLRAVALAALIILVWQPESLLGPGFQMSFAATTALVAVFGALRTGRVPELPRWARPVAAVVVSSAVAGLATAPVAAAHFNQFAHYGLIANLASVPLMGTVVIPSGVVAAMLMPLGLEQWPLAVMGLGLDWILGVAHWTSDLAGAVRPIPAPPATVLPLLALGGLFVMLWQGRGRWAGTAPVAAALLLWAAAERPPVLIAAGGALVGVMTEEGRALSKPRGAGFAAGVWLENDGDGAARAEAAARWPAEGALRVRHLWGKRGAARFDGCAPGEIVVLTEVFDGPPQPCLLLDGARMRGAGSLALYATEDGIRIESATIEEGRRLWSPAGAADVPQRLAALELSTSGSGPPGGPAP